jgi:secreted PhoX family phosphatase
MLPDGGDHAATGFAWEILLRCGDPSIAAVGATFSPATTKDGWFGMPDNCAIDSEGRLWIATDGNSPRRTGRSDGLWVVEAEGEARRTSRHFFRGPLGAELTGPCFTPDEATLFLAVQHPGVAVGGDPESEQGTFENPSTRWPDFEDGMPPRPSVVAITRRGGGRIAG